MPYGTTIDSVLVGLFIHQTFLPNSQKQQIHQTYPSPNSPAIQYINLVSFMDKKTPRNPPKLKAHVNYQPVYVQAYMQVASYQFLIHLPADNL